MTDEELGLTTLEGVLKHVEYVRESKAAGHEIRESQKCMLVLANALQSYREHEQHVAALIAASSEALSKLESLRGHVREGLVGDLRDALAGVSEFKIGGE